jgi:hypothetical protein
LEQQLYIQTKIKQKSLTEKSLRHLLFYSSQATNRFSLKLSSAAVGAPNADQAKYIVNCMKLKYE